MLRQIGSNRRLGLITLFLFLATVGSSAAQTEKKAAEKFDEFGDILYSDLNARLDNFGSLLMRESNVRGFIIVYRSRRDLPGLSFALALQMKDHLVTRLNVPQDRIVTVDGGIAMCLTRELWVVPVPPVPTPNSFPGKMK
jgi:hypothetical protein